MNQSKLKCGNVSELLKTFWVLVTRMSWEQKSWRVYLHPRTSSAAISPEWLGLRSLDLLWEYLQWELGNNYGTNNFQVMWEWDSLPGRILPENPSLPAQTSPGGGTSRARSARGQCLGKGKFSALELCKDNRNKNSSGNRVMHQEPQDCLCIHPMALTRGNYLLGWEREKIQKKTPLGDKTRQKKRNEGIWFWAGKKLTNTQLRRKWLGIKPFLSDLHSMCLMCHLCIIWYTKPNTKMHV